MFKDDVSWLKNTIYVLSHQEYYKPVEVRQSQCYSPIP